jgi:hypothetical protein
MVSGRAEEAKPCKGVSDREAGNFYLVICFEINEDGTPP